MFLDGLAEAVDRIAPKYILVYGFINEDNFDEFFGYAKLKGTKIVIPYSKIDRYKKESSIYGWR